jgi:hypothetical protein
VILKPSQVATLCAYAELATLANDLDVRNDIDLEESRSDLESGSLATAFDTVFTRLLHPRQTITLPRPCPPGDNRQEGFSSPQADNQEDKLEEYGEATNPGGIREC